MRRGSWAVALLLVACQGPEPQERDVARVEIHPTGVLLTPEQPARLVATAYDADGVAIDASVTWSVDDEAIQVGPDGLVTATASGSAQVTAEIDGVRASAVAVSVRTAPGVVLLGDDAFTGSPEPVDPQAEFGLGHRQRVTVGGSPPPVGTVVASTGEIAILGRVVSVDGASIVAEQVALSDAFEELTLEESIPLGDLPEAADASPSPFAGFRVGPFDCSTSRSVAPDLDLAVGRLEPTDIQTMSLDVTWTSARKTLALRGHPKVAFEVTPTLDGQLEGSLECRTFLHKPRLPLPGALGLVLGAQAPFGVGFSLESGTPLAQLGVVLAGEVGLSFDVGFECTDAGCTSWHDVEATPWSVEPELTYAWGSGRAQPEVSVFGWANLDVGPHADLGLTFGLLRAKAGLQLAGDFASTQSQAADGGYGSSYALSLFAEFRPGRSVAQFGALAGVAGLALGQWDADTIELDRSPTGSLSANRSTWWAGEQVTFTVELSPEHLDFGPLDHNVGAVTLFRVASGGALEPIGSQDASPGQTTFTFPWVAATDSGDTAVLAFVETLVVPTLGLEIAHAHFSEGDLQGLTCAEYLAGYTHSYTWQLGCPSSQYCVGNVHWVCGSEMNAFVGGDFEDLLESFLPPGTYLIAGTCSAVSFAVGECAPPE